MSNATIPTMADRHLVLVYARSTADSNAYEDWYSNVHAPALAQLANDGAQQHFDIAATKPLPGTNPVDYGRVALLEFEGDHREFIADLDAYLSDSASTPTGVVASPLTVLSYRPVSKVFVADRFTDAKSLDERNLLLVWSERPADPTEYDTWYDETHIQDFLSAPGVIRAQRLVPAAAPGSADSPDHGHLAFYEVDGDTGPVREEIKRQLMSGEMILPHFMQPPFDAAFLSPVTSFTPPAATR